MNVNFRVVYQAKTLKEFRELMGEFPAICSPSVARVASPSGFGGLAISSEERTLRDAYKAETGRNFRMGKNMFARYANPLEALQAWQGGTLDESETNEGKIDLSDIDENETV
jgi:hypothetical protein